MSEDSESHFTITFGRAGRVVKRAGGGSDDGIGTTGAVSGSKRSVKDRLGTTTTTNVDDSFEDRSHGSFKRQRIENNQGCHRRNSSNDTSLGDGDLRFKLMQKNISSQFQNDDPPTNMDLRDKLSSKSTLPHAHRRRSYSPKATLGKRKSMFETRDIYDGRGHNMVDDRTYEGERQSVREPRGAYRAERQSIREPRGAYSVEKRSMREPRDSYNVERHRMREPRGNYVTERPSIREPRDSYNTDRRSMREPRDNYNIERRSMREHRDSYNIDRRSTREPRDSHNVENRSTREPRDYNVERRSIREPRDAYNVDRRSLQDPIDSYNTVRRSMQEPRESNSIERRSIREPRAIHSVEEKSLREPRDNYAVGRRSIREPRDTCNADRQSIREPRDSYRVERRSMREPRDFCNGGKPSILGSRNDYDHREIGNVRPSSKNGSDLSAVGHSRTPYALDNLRRRSPLREAGSSMSPERNVEELQRKAPIRIYDDGTSNAYRINKVPSPHRTARSATLIQPGLNAAPRLLANPAPVAAQFHQSSGVLPRIPNHVQQSTTIDRFLQSMGLEEYSNRFKKEEVDFYALSQMSDPELKELGIPMGPRKRILHALSLLRPQRGV